MRKTFMRLSFAAISMAFAAVVAAQGTVGELLDKGGKMLTAVETKQELSGARMSAQTASGLWYELQFKADDSLGGWLESVRGRASLSGKWSVNEQAQYCWDYIIAMVNRQVTGCSRLFRLGSDVFTHTGGEGNTATVAKRELKK